MDEASDRRVEELPLSSLVWGWLFAGFSVVLPFLAIGAIVFGVLAIQRGKPGVGASMIAVSLLAALAFVYLASATLVPRDSSFAF